MVYGLPDLCGIHTSSMVLWFLGFWLFLGFLTSLLILGKTVIPHFHLFLLIFFWLRMDGLWISLSFKNPQVFHNALIFRVFVVYGFPIAFSHFGKNCGFHVVLYIQLFWLFIFVWDRLFMDFLTLGDSTAIPRCTVFKVLVV